MKKAKRWIVSAGACLLALTGMSVSFGQIPTAPIPEQNNDGLPLLTEPAPLDVTPIEPVQTPVAPAPAPAPQAVTPAPQQVVAPQPAAIPQQAALPQQYQAALPQQPCQQCNNPGQTCPSGAYYTPTPYYGVDSTPWWLNIRPVPYTPVETPAVGGFPMGLFGGCSACGVIGPFGRNAAQIEPPFYSTRGPRDFYLDNPRPLGY